MNLIQCDRAHSDAILAIFNDAILHSTALYDYAARTPAMMAAWFDAKEKGRYPVLGVIDDAGALAGFGSFGPFRAWPAYKYTIEHSVYVAPSHRRRGVGRTLLDALIEAARQRDFHVMVGGIDSSNTASINLHQQFGFQLSGTVRHAGFKFGRWLDLEFHQLILDTPASPQDG